MRLRWIDLPLLGALAGCGTTAAAEAPKASLAASDGPTKSAAPADQGEEGGVVGGVEGPPPEVKPDAPKTLPPNVARSYLIINPQQDPYRPRLPMDLSEAGAQFTGLFKVCVAATGEVDSVNLIKSPGDPRLDRDWPDVIRKWRYRPYMLGKKPVPFCFVLRLDVHAR